MDEEQVPPSSASSETHQPRNIKESQHHLPPSTTNGRLATNVTLPANSLPTTEVKLEIDTTVHDAEIDVLLSDTTHAFEVKQEDSDSYWSPVIKEEDESY